jgi:phosphohistidine phosphatase SixA
MVVGHEPDFTHTIFQITGGDTKMSKAGVALVELEAGSMKGELRWLVPPKFAKESLRETGSQLTSRLR